MAFLFNLTYYIRTTSISLSTDQGSLDWFLYKPEFNHSLLYNKDRPVGLYVWSPVGFRSKKQIAYRIIYLVTRWLLLIKSELTCRITLDHPLAFIVRSKPSISSYTRLTDTIKTKRLWIEHDELTIIEPVVETTLPLTVINEIVAQFIMNQ